ncbi:hypothetical protein ACIPC1_07400 [Streptomyces sp. NPDC087263]|uniref:hypothetical protein n=1 Tax=Streptomyces sp. NPDC087263 TaxID=3365773 RepID=UPI00381F5CCC
MPSSQYHFPYPIKAGTRRALGGCGHEVGDILCGWGGRLHYLNGHPRGHELP